MPILAGSAEVPDDSPYALACLSCAHLHDVWLVAPPPCSNSCVELALAAKVRAARALEPIDASTTPAIPGSVAHRLRCGGEGENQGNEQGNQLINVFFGFLSTGGSPCLSGLSAAQIGRAHV